MESEMSMPLIPSWMKQRNQLLAAIERRDIWPFVSVTIGTAVSQIAQAGFASMLFADDMIHFATPEAIILMDQAILTAPGGTGCNLATKRGGNV